MAEIRLILGLFLGLFLSVDFADSADVVGHKPVKATVGEDAILPCHLNNASDVSTLTVEWTLRPLIVDWALRNLSVDDLTVHVYKDRKHDHPQDEHFRGRTSMFPEEMSRGNISLKLTNVTEEDSGFYFCHVPRLNSSMERGRFFLTFLLKVYPQEDPGRSGGNGQTVVIVVVVVVVVIPVPAGIAFCCYICAGRRRRERRKHRNHRQGEGAESVEMDPQGPDPDLIPQGAAAQ